MGDTVEILGEQNGSLSLDTYMLTLGGAQAKQLFVNGDFEGTWIVGGTVSDRIVIGKVGADNTAEGRYHYANNFYPVTFVYDPLGRTLSFELGSLVMTVTANKVVEDGVTITELSLVYGEVTFACMNANNTYFDEYKGVYVAENSTIILDGFMNSRFGGGTALIFEGEESALISYQVDKYGHIIFVNEGVIYYIFLEKEGGKYVCGDKTYELSSPDILYGVSVYGFNANNEMDENLVYVFDGVSGVYDKNGKLVYTYVLNEQTDDDRLDNVYRLVLTDEKSGTKYNAVLDYGSTDYTLSLTTIPTKEN